MHTKSASKILVTKPSEQANTLQDLLTGAGLQGYAFPSIEIAPPKDRSTMVQTAEHMADIDVAIVVSANAAHAAAPLWQHAPKRLLAIGPGSAKALEHYQLTVDTIAEPPSSEGLLSLSTLQAEAIAAKRVLIFCGENPKPLLFKTLKARGADVEVVYCYRRCCPKPSHETITQLLAEPISYITVASPESLINLYYILAPKHLAWLLGKTLIVISPAMQQLAMKMGFLKSRVMVADNATNAALLNTLQKCYP